jgi:hypothetical protein
MFPVVSLRSRTFYEKTAGKIKFFSRFSPICLFSFQRTACEFFIVIGLRIISALVRLNRFSCSNPCGLKETPLNLGEDFLEAP